ncbi:hypothetical protein HER15_06555 [Tenacibaculum mesophilum]|uniref:DUF7033 domain-containing protein n=1 Tax=Tenacibaculum mesophilum TaxID=104268 RepID=A0AAE9SI23_9FLAO|nr:hypothetical protein [Tenacibaculum mesophilum]UTD15151.1 hypothetical protein HER15_06555 [Tenacibaculum mesophilum]GFD96230.1 polysaccharide deacetylase [Alteromonas sp. KUL154]GFE00117.1 polysaccharide deacetylase [Alteromonas sp. KUL156]
MKVFVPNNNLEERMYIIDVFFTTFLGVDYTVEKHQNNDWLLQVEDKLIVIKDTFFSNFHQELSYLDKNNIPITIQFATNEYTPEDNLPVIYGGTTIAKNSNSITCDIDIFASAFFMLTRWEEYVVEELDNHGRFPGSSSLAYKQNFLDRPIVNEYVELLWNMLTSIGYNKERKKRNYNLIVTHDLDYPFAWTTPKKAIRKLGGRILKLDFVNFFKLLLNFIKTKINYKNDNFYTFDFLFNFYDQKKLSTYFFLMTGSNKKLDGCYNLSNKKIKKIIAAILNKGHKIGFHPGYDSHINEKIWQQELHTLQENVMVPINVGRQHYLRYQVPKTAALWDKNDMKWDSSLYYSKEGGFRTGCCYEYPLFDFLTRRELKVKEKTLCFMDTTIIDNNINIDLKKISETVKKYSGDFVFLWHNSNLYNKKLMQLFKKSIEQVI